MKPIRIDIRPRPKQSVRLGNRGAYQPRRIVNYVNTLKWLIRKQWRGGFLTHPVHLEILFSFRAPKNTSKKKMAELAICSQPHTKMPDLDNLTKPLLDAMSGIVFRDDSLVYAIDMMKVEGIEDFIEVKVKNYENK